MTTGTAPPPTLPARETGRRGPFTRWPRASDAVLAAVMLLGATFVADGPGDSLRLRTLAEVPLPALGLLVVAAGSLWWRRRRPITVLAVVTGAWFGLTLLGQDGIGGAGAVAVYSTGRYAGDDRRGVAALAVLLVVATVESLRSSDGGVGKAVAAVVFMSAVWALGWGRHLRGQRAEEARRRQAAEAQAVVTEERTRIARELHDVVAHQVGLMTVQAGAARAVAHRDLPAAMQAMAAVEEAGREALGELRHLLGVLRPEPAEERLEPQPGLADVPALVERVRAAGVDVVLAADGLPRTLTARVDLFAYRIVQEALTNVLKHAGPGARARVLLTCGRGEVVVEVVDDGPAGGDVPADRDVLPGAGHGIIGMRERAALLGGRLEAGPRGRGFAVLASLPAGEDSP